METTLFERLKVLKPMLDEISDGMVVIDMDRRIQLVNRRAQEMLGYTEEEFLGSRCKAKMQSMDCENNCPFTLALNTGEESRDFEMSYQTKSGGIVRAPTSFVLLRDDEGNPVANVEIFRDIHEIEHLQEEVRGKYSFHNIIGKNKKMQDIYQLISEVAPTDASVLISGESGTGKELVARAIQYYSRRKDRPFISVSCAALAEGILESELFGHIRGAFTGAIADKPGRFELADGGTIFLDEIGEISPHTQVLLLRVLQEGEFERVGDHRTRQVNVRILTATNRNLIQMVHDGTFREDLYYRLNVVKFEIPPLRERKEDIPMLIQHILKRHNQRIRDKYVKGISQETMAILMEHDFPGNVRELENILEHSFIRCQGDVITPENLPREILSDAPDVKRAMHTVQPIKSLEKELILQILKENNGKLVKTAEKLGISRVTLWRKMKEYAIQNN